MPADLIVLIFDDTYGAHQAMSAVRALEEMDYAWLEDVAVIERHNSGRIATHTTHGSVTSGLGWGGLTGMIIGLLFPPIGFLALFAVGAGTGALVEKLTKETGLDKDLLADIRASLGKGTSALVLIGAQGDADEMARAFAKYEPIQVMRQALPDETVDALNDRLAQTPTD